MNVGQHIYGGIRREAPYWREIISIAGREELSPEYAKEHGKAFVFSPNEIGCVDPKIVELMVIFMIDHVPWN